MYVAYSIEINEQLSYTLLTTGNEIYNNNKNMVKTEIDKYVKPDGTIDATKMQDDWFPEIKADIFISHSSKDKQLAIQLAGWLKENFGLESFIDSCVWGYCDDLLRKIDEKYCRRDKEPDYFDYDKRNRSTSHVHNMLSVALHKMIDNSECIFFLNTKNSIIKNENDLLKITESPWIYNELSTIEIIRKKTPDYLKKIYEIEKRAGFKAGYEFSSSFPGFEYEVNFENLFTLNWEDLQKWKNNNSNKEYPLLYLYTNYRKGK